MSKIITVASSKGGTTKTRLSYEIANLLNAPLVDLDWDAGGASRTWGYRHGTHTRSPLLAALDSGRTPRLLPGHGRKPDLLAGHPDFASRQPASEQMAALLEKWAAAWDRPYVVVDTHPGAAHAGHGAMLAASVVIVPVILGTSELNALEEMLTEIGDYPLLLVPSRVPRTIPAAELRRLRRLVTAADVPVGPVIPYCRPLETRKRQAAVTAESPRSNTRDFTAAMHDVAQAVRSYADAT
jgi:chromosome partitioning protein